MSSRSALSLVAGKQPSTQLVSTVTRTLANIVIMSDVQGEVFSLPGFKNYKEGRLQVSVHNKLTVEKLRRQSSCGTVIWLSITELGILEDPDRKRNRVTLIAVISSLLSPDLPELSAELERVRQQFSPADSHP